jgi:hypothetical protein
MRSALFCLMLAVIQAPLSAKPRLEASRAEVALPPLDTGWQRVARERSLGGVYDYRKDGPFVVDIRLLEPENTLSACQNLKVNFHQLVACAQFHYPSSRTLPGADEALAAYERVFADAHSPAERISIALDTSGADSEWEIRQFATPDILNSFVPSGTKDEVATVAEKFAFQFAEYPKRVQWLYDKGAQLCMTDQPARSKRFSCIQFFLRPNNSSVSIGGVFLGNQPYLDTIAVLERNGFRPQTRAEIASAAEWRDVIGSASPTKLRYYSLLSPTNRRRVDALAEQMRREREASVIANQTAERDSLIGSTSSLRRSDADNRDAVRRLAIRGQTVCNIVIENSTSYVFRAVVEGNSPTRLQLRAASIRSTSSELDNYPYGDTRIHAGTVFWDDAANWRSGC